MLENFSYFRIDIKIRYRIDITIKKKENLFLLIVCITFFFRLNKSESSFLLFFV